MKQLLSQFLALGLLLTGCCLGEKGGINEPDLRYLLQYKLGDTLVYKADNRKVDTITLSGGLQEYNTKYYDCYTEQSRVYLYHLYNKKDSGDAKISIYANYKNDFWINTWNLNYDTIRCKYTVIDTIVNGIYRTMYHFYTAQVYVSPDRYKTVPSYLLYDLSYNTGIVQYRDTSGVMWTLQKRRSRNVLLLE